MKFSRVLLPESFKGTRGNPTRIKYMDIALKSFKFEGGESYMDLAVPGNTPQTNQFLRETAQDPNWTMLLCLALRYQRNKGQAYHICKDFLLALSGLKDREIQIDYLPDNFYGYLSFPENTIFDHDGDAVTGAYVFVGVLDDKSGANVKFHGKRSIQICYVNDNNPENSFLPITGRYMYELQPGMTAHDFCQKYKGVAEVLIDGKRHQVEYDGEDSESLFKTIVNVLLYIGSMDPELLTLTPTAGKPCNQANKYIRGGHLNECTIPVIAVNWDYKKLVEYVDDQTTVETHPRWQRCGPLNSLIKLIWVREHVRGYKKRVENNDENF